MLRNSNVTFSSCNQKITTVRDEFRYRTYLRARTYVNQLTSFRMLRENKHECGLWVKGRFMGLFQHCGRSAYCIFTPNKFPHSSPEAPRIVQMRETLPAKAGTITNEFC